MRISEIMGDFRSIQTYVASIRANPSAEAYNEDGYVVLREGAAQAQALLSQPFAVQAGSTGGDEEQDKAHLRRRVHCDRTQALERSDRSCRIIVDAATRRFQAQ